MLDLKGIVLPAFVGFFGGFLGPILVEQYKGIKEESIKQITMEEKLKNLDDKLTKESSLLEGRIGALENHCRNLELNQSRNSGVLKGRLPDIPLEGIPSS